MKLSSKFISGFIGILFLLTNSYTYAAKSFPQTTQMFYIKSNISGGDGDLYEGQNFTLSPSGSGMGYRSYVVGTTAQSGDGGYLPFNMYIQNAQGSKICMMPDGIFLNIPLSLDAAGNVFTQLTSYPISLSPVPPNISCPTVRLVVTGDSTSKSGYTLTID
jgi:hypothetical protein